MKIAITASGKTLDDRVDPRFGRCPCFLIVETDTLDVTPVENPNLVLGGGAGIQSAQLVAENGAEVVLTGNCGPNACRTLNAAGVQMILGVDGVVREAVEQFKAGTLSPTESPNVASHFGMGQGGGQGMGQGMGRGMGQGMGQGRGMGMGQAVQPSPPPPARKATPRLVATVDAKECTGCARCLDVCPTEAITVDTVAVVDVLTCKGCGECVIECPQDALSIRKI